MLPVRRSQIIQLFTRTKLSPSVTRYSRAFVGAWPFNENVGISPSQLRDKPKRRAVAHQRDGWVPFPSLARRPSWGAASFPDSDEQHRSDAAPRRRAAALLPTSVTIFWYGIFTPHSAY